jgi:dienelactone hydrolase
MAEKTLLLGAENHLVATLTPAESSIHGTPPFVAVLTNSGVIPRSGPHRMNVHLARRFAAMGIPSIRFDMSGLGDSRRSSGTLPVVEQWVADTRSVMDEAQSQFGCSRFFMVGFCSGAEVAHLVALEDQRLRGIVIWDLYAYATPQSKVRTLIYKLRRAGVLGSANKVFTRVLAALRALSKAPEPKDRAAEVSLVPKRDVFARRIQTLVDDGVEVLFAFCGGEPEWFNHPGQFRGMFGRYAFFDKVAFRYLDKSDHLITRREAQQSFTEMVVTWLQGRLLASS